MRIGETIGLLRKNKKIRANETYKNLLSRPAIIKFEKGESDTTAEKFMIILDRLNISLEEFEFFYNTGSTGYNSQLYSVTAYKKAFYNKDLDELNYLSTVSKAKYEETKHKKYQHNSAVINLLINILKNTNSYKDDLNLIQSYLTQCDYWSYYEIVLFTNTLSFHSMDFIEITYKSMKRTLNSYNGITRYKNEFAILIFNILHIKITSNNFNNLDFYLNELSKIKDECLDNMYIQTITKFYGIIIEIFNGNIQNIDEIHKIISIFEYLEMNFKAEQCRNLFSIVINENKTR